LFDTIDIQGFACLIEKEWVAFGHKFQQRHGAAGKVLSLVLSLTLSLSPSLLCSPISDFFDDMEQISPIFVQFLDCVISVVVVVVVLNLTSHVE
jgi:hypothetical protein